MQSAAMPLQGAHGATRSFSLLWPILLCAIALRLVFFNGLFGSDDVTYFASAVKVAEGDWSVARYNGALRYGFNLPAGALVYLFGKSFAVANLWPLLCSLLEIAAVYWFAASNIGRRAAWIAALMLALAPLHVAVATRIHADPVVSCFLTLSFVCIYQGMQGHSRALLFAAGLSLGMVFWTKELAAVCFAAFLPLLWYYRHQLPSALPVVMGGLAMLLLHFALMYALAGDPLHAIRVVLNAVQNNYIQGDGSGNEAWYYLPKLFVDVRHVGLLGWLALLGLFAWRDEKPGAPVKTYLAIWLLGLLLILSCFPVSLSPLRLTLKQSNYITLFLAPMALFAGALMASWSMKTITIVMVPVAGLGILLAALQQADYRSFTGNSKAVAEMALSQKNAVLLGSTNNSSVSTMLGLQHKQAARVISWKELQGDPNELEQLTQHDELFGVFDPQTAAWYSGPTAITKAPACWQKLYQLQPQDLGLGNQLAFALLTVSQALPVAAASRIGPRLEPLAKPAPATLYRVSRTDPWCKLEETAPR